MSNAQQAGDWALTAPSQLLLEGAPCLAGASDPPKAQEVGALPSRAASGCPPPPPGSQGVPCRPVLLSLCLQEHHTNQPDPEGRRLVVYLAEQSQVTQTSPFHKMAA